MGKQFKEYTDKSKFKNLMVVDGLNLAFRYKYANRKVFAAEYVKTVQSLAGSYKAGKVIVLGDGGSTYREAIYPDYKGNRKEMRAKQTEQEEQDFKEFLDEFNRAFDMLKDQYSAFRFKGVEADDIAAYLADVMVDNYEHVWLISSDKDWDLMINDKVSRFSFVTRKEISVNTWSSHYDYEVEDHISIKVLMGDKGDNVPGVPGVGIKRAQDLVRQYGTAYDIYAALPIADNRKFMQNLNDFKETLLTNYELMDLPTYCREAIGKENIQEIAGEIN